MDTVRSTRTLAEHFDAVVVSYEVGCVKPDPRIYQICLAQLGAQAVSTLFVDDRLENLEAAGVRGSRRSIFSGITACRRSDTPARCDEPVTRKFHTSAA